MSTNKVPRGRKAEGIVEWRIGEEVVKADAIFIGRHGALVELTAYKNPFVEGQTVIYTETRLDTPSGPQDFDRKKGLVSAQYQIGPATYYGDRGTYEATLDAINKRYKLKFDIIFATEIHIICTFDVSGEHLFAPMPISRTRS